MRLNKKPAKVAKRDDPRLTDKLEKTIKFMVKHSSCKPTISHVDFLDHVCEVQWEFIRFVWDNQGTNCPCGNQIKNRCILHNKITNHSLYVGVDCAAHLNTQFAGIIAFEKSLRGGFSIKVTRDDCCHDYHVMLTSLRSNLLKYNHYVVDQFKKSPLNVNYRSMIVDFCDGTRIAGLNDKDTFQFVATLSRHSTDERAVISLLSAKDRLVEAKDFECFVLDDQYKEEGEEIDGEYDIVVDDDEPDEPQKEVIDEDDDDDDIRTYKTDRALEIADLDEEEMSDFSDSKEELSGSIDAVGPDPRISKVSRKAPRNRDNY